MVSRPAGRHRCFPDLQAPVVVEVPTKVKGRGQVVRATCMNTVLSSNMLFIDCAIAELEKSFIGPDGLGDADGTLFRNLAELPASNAAAVDARSLSTHQASTMTGGIGAKPGCRYPIRHRDGGRSRKYDRTCLIGPSTLHAPA